VVACQSLTPLFPGGAKKYFFMKMLYNWFESEKNGKKF
jgi:hypothetical protein